MINMKSFDAMRKELKVFAQKREEVISRSREMIQLSKRIIYSVQRHDSSAQLVTQLKKAKSALPKDAFDTGMQSVALQEYVEALTLFALVEKGKLPTAKELNVPVHEYLMGLCDLTGELVRMAVNAAIRKQFQDVERWHHITAELYGEFLKLDLRNGELRKKSDQIKWNLQKLEGLMYDLKSKSS